MRHRAASVMVGVLVLVVAGCGGGAGPSALRVDKAAGTRPPKASDRTGSVSAGEGAALPDDFPKADVQLPERGRLVSASSFTTNGAKSWIVILKVTQDADQAATDYQHALMEAGYSVKDAVKLGDLVSTYTAVGAKYDVRVAGSGTLGSRTNPPGLLLTVLSHSASAG